MTTDLQEMDRLLKEIPQKALQKIRALAQGNGAQKDSIQIKSAKGELITFEATTHLELHTTQKEEIKPGKQPAGQVLPDLAQAEQHIKRITAEMLGNTDVRRELAGLLLERKDKGFSMHGQYFDLNGMTQDFCSHHACQTCNGQGRMKCTNCNQAGREICSRCHGRTMIPCQYCGSSGTMAGPDGKQVQCNRCFGNRQIPCTLCQKTGSVPCRICGGAGQMKCHTCKGDAYYTRILHVLFKMKPSFAIDRTQVPPDTVKFVEALGSKMAASGHIAIEAEQIKTEQGGLGIQYKGTFPFGELSIAINGKSLNTKLFGFKGQLLRLPAFIQGLVTAQRESLTRAAQGKGNVIAHVQKAAVARYIREAMILSLSQTKQNAMINLRQKYPIGVAKDYIAKTILDCNAAFLHVTKESRSVGFAIGGAITAILAGLYYLTPLRAYLGGLMGNLLFTATLDFGLIPLGVVISHFCAQKMMMRPLKKALGAHYPKGSSKAFRVKINPVIPFMIVGAIVMGVVYLGVSMGNVPEWWPFEVVQTIEPPTTPSAE